MSLSLFGPGGPRDASHILKRCGSRVPVGQGAALSLLEAACVQSAGGEGEPCQLVPLCPTPLPRSLGVTAPRTIEQSQGQAGGWPAGSSQAGQREQPPCSAGQMPSSCSLCLHSQTAIPRTLLSLGFPGRLCYHPLSVCPSTQVRRDQCSSPASTAPPAPVGQALSGP